MGKGGYVLACSLVEHDDARLVLSEERARKTEELALAVREMQVLDFHIERVRVLVDIAFGDDDVPELYIFQGLHDGLVVTLL